MKMKWNKNHLFARKHGYKSVILQTYSTACFTSEQFVVHINLLLIKAFISCENLINNIKKQHGGTYYITN